MSRKALRRVLLCFMAVALVRVLGQESERATGGGGMVKVDPDAMPLVALTFDDGPRRDTTGPLLDGLAQREAPATFFLVGERIPGSEDLVARMKAEGHQIGIHTFNHVMVTELTKEEFDVQVGETRALVEHIVGPGDAWLRPPYGILNDSVVQWANGPLILWSVDPEDWKDHNVDRIVSSVVGRVKDGDIILMHDIYPESVEAALRIVDTLQDRGYSFVTVEQLMALRQITPAAGERYTAFPPK